MPTTANFSLEYPDDNSSVDIAGHFETLADDVDAAINTRLALTGGTLTGALAGTLTTDASSSTTGAFKTAGGMGIAKALYVGTTLNVTGATTLTGDLTISKASPGFKVSSSSGNANAFLERPAGSWGQIYFRTGTSTRWVQWIGSGSESGSNAGSDFGITRYDDAGSSLGTALSITRASGLMTLTGDLTISKASPAMVITGSGLSQLQITSTASNYAQIELSRAAGQWAATFVRTGSTLRWGYGVNGDAESGANAGSNFVFYTYNDAGGYLGNPITITRSTGAVTLTGTLNGKVVNDLVTGPASATDDALVRFDNTTGKVVQNSGITVDDSGNVSSNLTISKATPIMRVTSSSGSANVYIDRASGAGGLIAYRTGTSWRWEAGATATAEGGSDTGSNYQITRYSDAGAGTGAFLIYRDTGKVTLGAPGATAGLELAVGGPRVMSGTGSPEGVVTAPVGSTWIDTNATTGAIKWIKATGTGNTGWVVEYGDTGWRDITSLATANAGQTLGKFNIRRVGNVVHVGSRLAQSTNSTRFVLFNEGVWPTGFAPPTTTGGSGVPIPGTRNQALSYLDSVIEIVPLTGYPDVYYIQSGGGNYVDYYGSYVTGAAWPTSLPGSAA